jgi:hypothetical protein
MTMHETPSYSTTDFYFAATLLTLGMELVEVDRADLRRVRFTFSDDARRREWTRSYLAGRLRLDPVVLFHSSRTLKRAVYQDGGPLNDVPGSAQRSDLVAMKQVDRDDVEAGPEHASYHHGPA